MTWAETIVSLLAQMFNSWQETLWSSFPLPQWTAKLQILASISLGPGVGTRQSRAACDLWWASSVDGKEPLHHDWCSGHNSSVPGIKVAAELIGVWLESLSKQFLSRILGYFQKKIGFSLVLHPFQHFCELPGIFHRHLFVSDSKIQHNSAQSNS